MNVEAGSRNIETAPPGATMWTAAEDSSNMTQRVQYLIGPSVSKTGVDQ